MNYSAIEILLAVLLGGVPTLVWLWFWLTEDRKHPEPATMLIVTFMLGALSVLVTLPIQELLVSKSILTINSFWYFFSLAGIEEVIKFGSVYLLIAFTPFVDEPIDYAIYLITGALGFAALENIFYLIDPIHTIFDNANLTVTSLRFMGSTVIHAVMASLIGLLLGFKWHKKHHVRAKWFLTGLILATILHASFNFFIINGSNLHLFISLVLLWILAIIAMYLFEKIKKLT